ICAHWTLPLITFVCLIASMILQAYPTKIPYLNVADFTVDSVLSVILIVQMIVLGDRAPWTWINWRWVRFIGTISYSLYLYNAIGPDAINSSALAHTFLRVPLSLLAGLTLAIGSYYVIERPFLKLKSKYENSERNN